MSEVPANGPMPGFVVLGISVVDDQISSVVRDADGDLYFLGATDRVLRTADGPVFIPPIAHALSRLKSVDQVVVYGVGEPGHQVVVAAMTRRRS